MRPFGIFSYFLRFIMEGYYRFLLSIFSGISNSEGEVKKQKNIVLFTALLASISVIVIYFNEIGSVDRLYLFFVWFILHSFFVFIGGILYSIYIKNSDKLPENMKKVEYTTEEVRFNKITED